MRIALIDSSSVFYTHKEIFLDDSLKLSMSDLTLQIISLPFNDGNEKEHDHKVLKSLNLFN